MSTVLSRAFFDDPVFVWGIPDDDRRRLVLPEFFGLGFQAEEAFAPPGGPPLWPMWRQPASDR
jgi:hypothetical protein